MKSYTWFARYYDLFNSADYDGYSAYIKSAFDRSLIPVAQVLDAGCGTGEISLRLAGMGYDVTAVDISTEMLAVFRNKINNENILLLNQDIRELDLYGTVQAVACTFDCLNYMKNTAGLRLALSSLRKFLEPGGTLVFDVNNKYAYEKVYSDNSYIYEQDENMLVWQNSYDKTSKNCNFILTLFENTPNGYIRYDEVQTQKHFSDKTIAACLKEAGFSVICKDDGSIFGPAKTIYTCRAV